MKASIKVVFTNIFLFACLTAYSQTNLAVSEFVRVYKATPNAQLLDVRTPAEWENGKIEASACVDFMDADFKKNITKLDKSKPIFVYCAAGGRSAKASKILQDAGFKKVYNLSGGGFNQLQDKGLK